MTPSRALADLAYSAETYAGLIVTDPILAPVVADLGLPFDVADLKGIVSVSPVFDTELLRLSVTDTDPMRAAAIANAVADQFVNYMGSRGAEVVDATRAAIESQIDSTTQEVDGLAREIDALEQSGDADNPAVEAQIEGLQAQLVQREETLAQLEAELAQVDREGATTRPEVTVIERASVPTSANPVAGGRPTTLLAAFAGLLVAVAVLILVEFLDTSVRTNTDVFGAIGAPVLSTIPKLRGLRDPARRLFIVERPNEQASESVRLLRTNIEFASAAHPVKVLVVSSAAPGEGKSTVAANLAVAMAQAGLKTVLVDADLRQSVQHRIFEVPNDRGLTTLLRNSSLTWDHVRRETRVANLSVVPGGPLPSNPADLLSLERLERLLEEIREQADIIVVDTPPILAVSDPLVVAAHADGLLLVCRLGRTSVAAVGRVSTVLRQGSVRVVGVVLNGKSRRDDGNVAGYPSGYYPRTWSEESEPSIAYVAQNGHARDKAVVDGAALRPPAS